MFPIYVLLMLKCVASHQHIHGIFDNVGKFDESFRTVAHPVNSNSTFKTVCYYPMSQSLNTTDKHPLPPGLNSHLCSYLIFIPTFIDSQNRIMPGGPGHLEMFQRAIPVIRQQNPKLIIMVSNGGNISPTMKSLNNTLVFIQSAVEFLRKYGFDGIDLDWEFPTPQQYSNYSRVLIEMRKEFEAEAEKSKKARLLITAAVLSGEAEALRIYDFNIMNRTLDFVNMMGYDLHVPSDTFSFTNYNSPLPDLTEFADFWASKIGKSKIVVGIPFYCHAYKLEFPSLDHGYYAPSNGKGQCDSGKTSCACDAINHKNASVVFDSKRSVPYCYYGDQWISYENVKSVSIKTKWILENGFSGVMVWNMISDDVYGVCDGKTRYPLMNAVLKTIANYH